MESLVQLPDEPWVFIQINLKHLPFNVNADIVLSFETEFSTYTGIRVNRIRYFDVATNFVAELADMFTSICNFWGYL